MNSYTQSAQNSTWHSANAMWRLAVIIWWLDAQSKPSNSTRFKSIPEHVLWCDKNERSGCRRPGLDTAQVCPYELCDLGQVAWLLWASLSRLSWNNHTYVQECCEEQMRWCVWMWDPPGRGVFLLERLMLPLHASEMSKRKGSGWFLRNEFIVKVCKCFKKFNESLNTTGCIISKGSQTCIIPG